MPDFKIHDLTDIGTPAATDELYVVGAPATTPVDRRVTVRNLRSHGLRRVRLRGNGNKTTTSASFAAIDSTNLPYQYVTLTIGDIVEMSISGQWAGPGSSNYCELDFDVDYPTATDGRVNSDAGNGVGLTFRTGNSEYGLIRSTFIAVEAGSHGFRPVWKSRTAGQTVTLYNGTSDPDDSTIEFIVENKGPAGAGS